MPIIKPQRIQWPDFFLLCGLQSPYTTECTSTFAPLLFSPNHLTEIAYNISVVPGISLPPRCARSRTQVLGSAVAFSQRVWGVLLLCFLICSACRRAKIFLEDQS